MPPKRTRVLRTSRKNEKSTVAATASLAKLAAGKAASTKKFGKARATTDKYEQRRKQGRLWLMELMKAEANTEHPLGCPDVPKWSMEDLSQAFAKTPSQASPWVLALFIASKCFGEDDCGKSTAQQIHAAFKELWDQSDPNGIYQGRWAWDEQQQCGRGNPASSTEVEEILTAVKNRQGSEGTRSHSCAMKKEYMELIMEWSSKQCPPSALAGLGHLATSEYCRRLPMITKHYFMRAFATSGWNIWTRNFELAKLQYKHIVEDAWTDDGYQFQHLLVTLENRKGWQNKLSKETDLHGHRYEIHPQRDMPAVDMEFHLREWLAFLRAFVYGRELQDDDYIFPSVNGKGLVQPGAPISHDTIQKWLDEFVAGAGIKLGNGRLTTHCFRRGGAQYRFMYAPVGKRWSLATIHWWGGWAEGEHRDTLIRYLLDELYYYEEGHGDALRPIPKEADKSFLGEHAEIRPATKQEIQAMLGAQLDNLTHKLVNSCHPAVQSSSSPLASESIQRQGEQRLSMELPATPTAIQSTMICPATESESMPRTLCIPLLPRTGSMNARWKRVIQDWDEPDLSRGHQVALKDWEPSWYTGRNRERFGVQYGKRKMIAHEFIDICNRDEATFLRKWPIADTGGPSKLLEALQAARLESGSAKRRNSKYNTTLVRARAKRAAKA